MTMLTEYAKDVLRRNPDRVRSLMRLQGRSDEEVDELLESVGCPDIPKGGALADIFSDIERVDTDGNRN